MEICHCKNGRSSSSGVLENQFRILSTRSLGDVRSGRDYGRGNDLSVPTEAEGLGAGGAGGRDVGDQSFFECLMELADSSDDEFFDCMSVVNDLMDESSENFFADVPLSFSNTGICAGSFCSVLSWNCRGIREDFSSKNSLISDYDIVLLQETFEHSGAIQVDFSSDFFVFRRLGLKSFSYGRAAGGLISIFRRNVFLSVDLIAEFSNFQFFRVKARDGGFFFVANIYRASETSPIFMPEFFDILGNFISRCGNVPVIISGDFNAHLADHSFDGSEFCSEYHFLATPLCSIDSKRDEAGHELIAMAASRRLRISTATEHNQSKSTLTRGIAVIDYAFASQGFIQSTELLQEFLSDHFPVVHTLNVVLPSNVQPSSDTGIPVTRYRLDYSKFQAFSFPAQFVAISNGKFTGTLADKSHCISHTLQLIATLNVSRSKKSSKLVKEISETRRRIRRAKKNLLRRGQIPMENRAFQNFCDHLRWLCEQLAIEDRARVRTKFQKARASGDAKRSWEAASEALELYKSSTNGVILDRKKAEAFFQSLYLHAFAPRLIVSNVSDLSIAGSVLNPPVSLDEVRDVIVAKHFHKAPGPDGLNSNFFKVLQFDDLFCQVLASFFQMSTQPGRFHLIGRRHSFPFFIKNMAHRKMWKTIGP